MNVPYTPVFFNHRAKRGGSLFQGGSGGEGGREATPTLLWGHPPFVSFRHESCPKRQRISMKLGTNDLWAKPDRLTRPLFLSASKGLRYLPLKVEKLAFLSFLSKFKAVDGPNRWIRT